MNVLKKKNKTRSALECPIFGHPRDLLDNKLPTYEDALRCCCQEQYKISLETNNRKVCISKVFEIVARKICILYEKASIPTLTEFRVIQITNAYYKAYNRLRKSYNRDKDKAIFQKNILDFKKNAFKLFDIAVCKCVIILNCICKKTLEVCECPISISCRCVK